jgi:hypothetical protein
MFLPVDRSISVSPPQRHDQTSFSTSSSMLEVTAELPMIAVDLHPKVAADDHRLQFGMIDVRRNDGAAPPPPRRARIQE